MMKGVWPQGSQRDCSDYNYTIANPFTTSECLFEALEFISEITARQFKPSAIANSSHKVHGKDHQRL